MVPSTDHLLLKVPVLLSVSSAIQPCKTSSHVLDEYINSPPMHRSIPVDPVPLITPNESSSAPPLDVFFVRDSSSDTPADDLASFSAE